MFFFLQPFEFVSGILEMWWFFDLIISHNSTDWKKWWLLCLFVFFFFIWGIYVRSLVLRFEECRVFMQMILLIIIFFGEEGGKRSVVVCDTGSTNLCGKWCETLMFVLVCCMYILCCCTFTTKVYASSDTYIYSISNMFLPIHICMEGPPTISDVPFSTYFFLAALLASLKPVFFHYIIKASSILGKYMSWYYKSLDNKYVKMIKLLTP